MFGLKAKLIAAAVVLIALGALAWRINAWRNGYLERDQAVADLAAYEAAVAAREKEASEERARAALRSAELSAVLAKTETELADLRSNPITRVVTRERIINGVSCPDPRLGPDVARMWNQQADAASRAVLASD